MVELAVFHREGGFCTRGIKGVKVSKSEREIRRVSGLKGRKKTMKHKNGPRSSRPKYIKLSLLVINPRFLFCPLGQGLIFLLDFITMHRNKVCETSM